MLSTKKLIYKILNLMNYQNGVDDYKSVEINFGNIPASGIVTLDANISASPATHRIIKGYIVSNTADVAILVLTFVDKNTIRIRARNLINSQHGGSITVYYA